jgi:hypothetical protein
MENRRNLANIALAALIMASATPVNGLVESTELQGIFFAAADCAAHGCPAAKNNSATTIPTDNNPNNNGRSRTNADNSQSAPPRVNPNSGNSSPSSGYNGPTNDGYYDPSRQTSGYLSYVYVPRSSYNSQQPGITSPTYVEDYRGVTYDTTPRPTPEYGGLATFYRDEYNNTWTDNDFNRGVATTAYSSATLTEAQLLGMLTSQGRAIYLNLDPEAKALAIQLASQDSYRDKNLAVKEAQRRMNMRRGLLYR